MRKLMLSTAMVLPLMVVPAIAQDDVTPDANLGAPAGTTTTTTETAPTAEVQPSVDEVPASQNTEAAAETQDQAAIAASGKVEQQQAENELRIDWITDTTVNSPDGNAIGEINDVIVDAQAGTMKAAVIGVGGFLGIGEKQIAIPWDQLQINYDAQQITSDLTQEEADAAPEYVFREQEAAPNNMGGETSGGGMGADDTMISTSDTPTTTTIDPAAATTEPVMTDTNSATTTTTAPMAPADTAETPATEPADAGMGSDTMEPAAGTTAPAN